MERGYIRLWRKSLDSRAFLNAELWQLWTYCLMKATHKDRWVVMSTGKGETEVLIKKGQFVFGRKKAASELRSKPFSTYKRLLKLKKLGNITIQSNAHYSVVSICNWETYQNPAESTEHPKEQAGNRQGTTKEQARNTDKNNKNNKNNNNKHIFSNSPYFLLSFLRRIF